MKSFQQSVVIVFKGFCMGIADVIPGVSGGTIAFLMGIYDELLHSVASFDVHFIKNILRGRIIDAFTKTGWNFLALLLTGILSAIFLLSHLMKWLMVEYPIYVNSVFFGLIASTVFIVARKVKRKNAAMLASGLVSAVLTYFLVGLLPITTPETWWFLVLSGAIAICAMILPGISGAFILLLMGKYEFILTAVIERNFSVLIVFCCGCVLGLAAFVRVLRWLLHHYRDVTLAILAGIVLGSLRKIWPWKETLSTMVTSRGKVVPLQEANVLPQAFSMDVVFALVLISAGVAISLWLAAFDQEKGA